MTAEFSYPIPMAKIGTDGLTVRVTASPDECAVMAERMAIPAVHELTCLFHLTPARTDPTRIAVSGTLRARVTRECIVSTEEFEMRVEDAFTAIFVPEGEESDDLDPDTDDEIPYRGDAIDLGEAAAQQLALALDPYPRIEGATMPDIGDDEDRGPFAALKRLADGDKKPH